MQQAEQIMTRINELKEQLRMLEMNLGFIQTKCNHDFTQDAYYQTCKICQYVEAFYY